jgi:hypothetical protein
MLLKSKEEIAWDVHEAVMQAMRGHVSVGWNVSSNSVMGQLSELIALAVQVGVTEALKNMYTNEEFERDTGLDKA